MIYLQVLFYGIIEGLTEWLPVSSTGHLILFESFWPLQVSSEFLSMFRVVIQLGAILAVIVLYFDRLNPFSRRLTPKRRVRTWQLWLKIAAASVPAGIVGLLVDNWFDAHMYIWQVVAAMLALFGGAFILVEAKKQDSTPMVRSTDRLSYFGAFAIGLFQVLALVPGVSRSGATILGALLLGVSRTAAAEFSFFMAIPVVCGASFLKLLKHGIAFTGNELALLALGMVTAFIVSVFVIRFFMEYIRKRSFTAFGIYRIGLAVVVAAIALIFPTLLP